MALGDWFNGQNMLRVIGATYILNGIMACFAGDFFMEQSFAEWTDDAEANELGLYLLDALGGILIGFGLFIIMASLANGRLRCQGILSGAGRDVSIRSYYERRTTINALPHPQQTHCRAVSIKYLVLEYTIREIPGS